MTYWYGGRVQGAGRTQPYRDCYVDLRYTASCNQESPYFLSSDGDFLQADCLRFIGFEIEGWQASRDRGRLGIRDAYQSAISGRQAMPRSLPFDFAAAPICNDWIELNYEQDENAILSYAESLRDMGIEGSVFMIDDGWQPFYGEFSYDRALIQNPRQLFKNLRKLGFLPMLWICPYVSPDQKLYRDLLAKSFVDAEPISWWNGYSAPLCLENEEVVSELRKQLDRLMEDGAVGFKFDGGDSYFYRYSDPSRQEVGQRRLDAWVDLASEYTYNEVRVSRNAAFRPILSRLCDKSHSWGDQGLASLIADSLIQSMTGHLYSCPDMVGGGEYMSFQSHRLDSVDRKLFMRFLEASVLMPSFQISALPSRILDADAMQHFHNLLALRKSLMPELKQLWERAATHLEPIIRPLEYALDIKGGRLSMDCFALGDDIIVQPILSEDNSIRRLELPDQFELIFGDIEKGPFVYRRK